MYVPGVCGAATQNYIHESYMSADDMKANSSLPLAIWLVSGCEFIK